MEKDFDWEHRGLFLKNKRKYDIIYWLSYIKERNQCLNDGYPLF